MQQSPANTIDSLAPALRQARLAEAAHYEAAMALRDSKSLRLAVLKDDLAALVSGNSAAAQVFDLALSPGDPPRLWIDLITSVMMEPDYRTYRLVQDTRVGRETLCETPDRDEMAERIKVLMAHRLVDRERQIAGRGAIAEVVPGYSAAALILAWVAGVAVGALALLGAAIYMNKL